MYHVPCESVLDCSESSAGLNWIAPAGDVPEDEHDRELDVDATMRWLAPHPEADGTLRTVSVAELAGHAKTVSCPYGTAIRPALAHGVPEGWPPAFGIAKTCQLPAGSVTGPTLPPPVVSSMARSPASVHAAP